MERFPKGPRDTPTHHHSSAQRRDCANRIKTRSKPLTRIRRQFLLLRQAPADFVAMWRNDHTFSAGLSLRNSGEIVLDRL
jgi:hypothetical protein